MKSDNKHETMPVEGKFLNTDTVADHSATAFTIHQELAGPKPSKPQIPVDIGGPKRLEPTRYGDWEKNGRCIDF